jgi:hypothetical protein
LPKLLKKREDEWRTRGLSPHDYWDVPFKPEPDLEPAWSWLWNRLPRIPLVGAGVNMAWYLVTMRQLARLAVKEGEMDFEFEPDYTIGAYGALICMWVWIHEVSFMVLARLVALCLCLRFAVPGVLGW